jgi:outer membrane protein OmpA-like peptidoglycan-associated protein
MSQLLGSGERTGPGVVQRACEKTAAPPMDCKEGLASAGTGTPILFGLDSSGLTDVNRRTISKVAEAWHAGGNRPVLRLDGFASCDGAADKNWKLSCSRAKTVAAELEAPTDGSPGVPNTHIDVRANGETEQFDSARFEPNRRVIIIGAGNVPPPGPTCGLKILGLDEVDHYCARYTGPHTPCGLVPGTDSLRATGGARGATLTWSIVRGASRASIAGANTGVNVTIQGDAPSKTQGDVTVQVTDGKCTAAFGMTVREPSSMTMSQFHAVGRGFVTNDVTYTVHDQFGNPMGVGICVDETLTVCSVNVPMTLTDHDDETNPAGQLVDNLAVNNPNGIDPTMCIKVDQVMTAGGCGPLMHNTLLFRPSGITVTPGTSCRRGDPCP